MFKHPRVLSFLDLEATRHDAESDEEGDQTEEDDFLDDDATTDTDSLLQDSTIPQSPSIPDDFEQWTNELLQRHAPFAISASTSQSSSQVAEATATYANNINVNLPIWRIQCLRGWEDILCNKIKAWFPSASQENTVFTLSRVPGWVYWSCTQASMSRYRVEPFDAKCIIRKGNERVMYEVPEQEKTSVLSWLQAEGPLWVKGKWVRISKGKFRDVVGVVAMPSNVYTSVLVVPLTDWTAPNIHSHSKKRTREQPWVEPRLFDHSEAQARERIGSERLIDRVRDGETHLPSDVVVIDGGNEKFKYRGVTYWHGLAVIRVPSNSLSGVVGAIDSRTATLFKDSHHPLVNAQTMPRCIGWVFDFGEHVKSKASGIEAIVNEIHDRGLLATTTTDSKVVTIAWHDVVKVFYLGDFVRILDGSSVGKEYIGEHVRVLEGSSLGKDGWVHHIQNEDAHILRLVRGSDAMQTIVRMEHYVSHVNFLTLTANTDISGDTQPSEVVWKRAMATGPTPWLNVAATIIQPGHPLRTYPAVVKDVLINQDTPSGLKVLLEITTYNAAIPRRTQTIDFDCVVDPETQWHLQLRHPLRASQRAYFPRSDYTWDKIALPIPPPKPLAILDRPSTPVPDRTESSTPAWDPRIHEPPSPLPWVLDKAFVGCSLRLSNGSAKKAIVGIPTIVGEAIILYTVYRNKLKETEASGMVARHPGARWMGPLMIIAGSDKGKYVRPVRQRTVNNVVQWTVRVCDRKEAGPDAFLDEELDIPSSWLCEVHEDDEGRARNDAQARQLKEPAAGHGF